MVGKKNLLIILLIIYLIIFYYWKYIIGFEDSMVGYRALKNITDTIYVYDNLSLFEKNDCYIFDDFLTLVF